MNRIGSTDAIDMIENAKSLISTGGHQNDTMAVSGIVGCNPNINNSAVQLVWYVLFDDHLSGDVGFKK